MLPFVAARKSSAQRICCGFQFSAKGRAMAQRGKLPGRQKAALFAKDQREEQQPSSTDALLAQLAEAQQQIAAYERWRGAFTAASEMITSALNLEAVAEQIVSVVRSSLGAHAAWLLFYVEETKRLRLRAI